MESTDGSETVANVLMAFPFASYGAPMQARSIAYRLNCITPSSSEPLLS